MWSLKMGPDQQKHQSANIDQEQLLAFVRAMIGGGRGREDDEHPLPPGPWDPVIRIALERIGLTGVSANPRSGYGDPIPWRSIEAGPGVPWRAILSAGPRPEPWRVILA